MTPTERRERLRAVFAGNACITPASVWDPISARVAENVGFEVGMLAGSVASATTLAAPDLIVLTLTEFADQVRRIMRVSDLSLMLDADHGYGNALNVRRTIEECEHAGAAGLSIEDTALPVPFGSGEGETLLSVEEGVGKMKAALSARRDKSFVIAGRTSAPRIEGTEGTVRRLKAYAEAGVDAVFAVGLESLDQLAAIRTAVGGLPIIVGSAPASISREELAKGGARILIQGHPVLAATVKALQDAYSHLHSGGKPSELASRIATNKEMDAVLGADLYKAWRKEFLS
jgi:carboxyvinyl-carboxyphosphonate phosphorylmutase